MDEDRAGWKTLPPPLLLALWLTAVRTALAVFVGPTGSAWVLLAGLGADATANALYACGALELAQRHTGARRRGLQIAAAAWFAALALQFVWLGRVALLDASRSLGDEAWFAIERYSWFMAEVTPFVGLGIATMRRNLALASVGVAVVCHPPPFAERAIWEWLAVGAAGAGLLEAMLSVLGTIVIAALVVRLAPPARMPEPGRAAAGLRRAAAALRIQMVAVILGTCPILFALAIRGGGPSRVYLVAMVAATAVHAAASGWFALGLLGAARDGALSRTKLVIAGATSLWCGAVVLAQFLFAYAAMDGSRGSWMHAFRDALSLGVPLVALVGVAILAAALGPRVARHRQEPPATGEVAEQRRPFGVGLIARSRDQRLWRDTTGQLAWIIVLMLASAAIEGWFLPQTDSLGALEVLTLTAAVCSLVALLMVAQLCSAAAEALDPGPGLPAARLLAPG